MTDYPKPPFPKQAQAVPGAQSKMQPYPDCGEQSYVGSGRLAGKIALITGADSGIGRAVAIAFAREGADVMISYLEEDEDANETARLVEEAGRKAILARGIKPERSGRGHWAYVLFDRQHVDLRRAEQAGHIATCRQLNCLPRKTVSTNWANLTKGVFIYMGFYL